jgi:polysaccharide export outer membrane protein
MNRRLPTHLAALAALIAISGCTTTAPPLAVDASSSLQGYRLGAGDRLRVTVYNEPALTGEFALTDNGSLAFPLIGDVPADGKSIVELRDMLTTKLGAGYVANPKVSVEVVNYRPYYILGEVGRAGSYPFVAGLTVSRAIAMAGGYSTRANTSTIFIKRENDPVERSIAIKKTDVKILPGDLIRVGERYF